MRRKDYESYWKSQDVLPINEAQCEEVARLKEEFVLWLEKNKFPKGARINIDPMTFELKEGEGDSIVSRRKYKWNSWEFSHIRKWVLRYLSMEGFDECYHFQLRAPIGVIELQRR